MRFNIIWSWLFDCFGIDHEVHSEGCYAINAGSHMRVPFPQLPEDGMTLTYSREVGAAIRGRDIFDLGINPLVTGAMDIVLAGEFGNTTLHAASVPDVARGTILLESVFVLESASTDTLQSDRFLPPPNDPTAH